MGVGRDAGQGRPTSLIGPYGDGAVAQLVAATASDAPSSWKFRDGSACVRDEKADSAGGCHL